MAYKPSVNVPTLNQIKIDDGTISFGEDSNTQKALNNSNTLEKHKMRFVDQYHLSIH